MRSVTAVCVDEGSGLTPIMKPAMLGFFAHKLRGGEPAELLAAAVLQQELPSTA